MGCSCRSLFLCGKLMSTSVALTQPPPTPNRIQNHGSSVVQSLSLFPLRSSLKTLHTDSILHLKASPETRTKCCNHETVLPFNFSLESSGDGGQNNNNNNNNPNDPWWWNDGCDSSKNQNPFFWLLSCSVVFFCFIHLQLASAALAKIILSSYNEKEAADASVWEIRGSRWIRLIPDFIKDEFLIAPSSSTMLHDNMSPSWMVVGENIWQQCKGLFIRLMLPEGFPDSVTSDYLDYSLWRGVQGVASQISSVLATQALLYAVGLGKGAIPTAAAINWVLKDGLGYLSKIILSKYGRHFDVNPKGWRLFADLLENAAFGLEILTPGFPNHFVFIGAAAGAGRSAAALIQAATRSCFYAGFAAQRNFAEVIAKGEAQGMVSKFIGIMLGIALANYTGSSTPLALASFCAVTWIHMFCNLKSYQSIQLRTLNPYRASLVFSEYLLSGQVPPIKEVNDEEPLFPAIPLLNVNSKNKPHLLALSSEARVAAAEIEKRLQLGSKLSNIVTNKDEVLALFNLYRDEGYILAEHKGRFCVVLKESCSGQDMLKALFQVNYLYWLERNAGIEARHTCADCGEGGRLQISLEYTQREFGHVSSDSVSVGWVADGLIARPLPNRISPCSLASSMPSSS